MIANNPIRYGVFLRPNPEFARVGMAAMDIVRRQFGLIAAASYPLHTTLVGSIATDAAESELIACVDKALDGEPRVCVRSLGLRRSGAGIVYALDDDGSAPSTIRDLMGSVLNAVDQVRHHPPGDFRVEHRMNESPATYTPHASVLSFDGEDTPGIADEAIDFLRGSGVDSTAVYGGDVVSLYRFTSDDWSGRYWESMRWSLLRSWTLGRAADGAEMSP